MSLGLATKFPLLSADISTRKSTPMLLHSLWIPVGVLAILVLYQQFRIYRIHRDSKKREELFQIVTENAADMIALVDVKGRRLYNSPAYKRVLGYTAAELGETSAFEQIHPEDRFKVLEAAREARASGIGRRLEYRIKHKDGSWRTLESQASTIRDAKGQVGKLVIVNRDISERKRAEQELEHNRFHDSLTGLPNRSLFLDRLQQLFVRAQRKPDYRYALLLANIDHFKVFNETLGVAAGDQILQEVARRIAAHLRPTDTTARNQSGSPSAEPALSRVGGDEFSILLDGVGDPSDAMRVAKRIQAVVAEPFFAGSPEVRASVSVGIALSTAGHRQPEDLLKEADAALRRAKGLGGSRCEVLDEAMHARAVGRLRLEADLRTAIAGRQFRIHYQPVVELDTRRTVSFEALLRWEHPTEGLILPDRFMEAAKDTGLLVSIGHWLIQQVCRQLREWEFNPFFELPLNVSVNLCARQFADARLASDLQDVLRETGVDVSHLRLEITENLAAADPKLTGAVLSQLKALGIGLILDDFGAWSSSLCVLRRFPVNALKIHRSLVQEMQQDRTASDLVEVIIILARKMHLQVIAEGIETARQAERLREMGCEFGQGSYFAQPLEATAALEFLRQHAAARGTGVSSS